jgi:hypothetical protein
MYAALFCLEVLGYVSNLGFYYDDLVVRACCDYEDLG